jgi:hypothetical protein
LPKLKTLIVEFNKEKTWELYDGITIENLPSLLSLDYICHGKKDFEKQCTELEEDNCLISGDSVIENINPDIEFINIDYKYGGENLFYLVYLEKMFKDNKGGKKIKKANIESWVCPDQLAKNPNCSFKNINDYFEVVKIYEMP